MKLLQKERGQMLILFVAIFTVIMLAGAITVDVGLWFSERRGAQTDADLVALAGAYQLLDGTNTASAATDAVGEFAVLNDLDPLNDIQNLAVRSLAFPDGFEDIDDYCHDAQESPGPLNAVVLDVDHDSRSLFATALGVNAPDIGAHACARAGAATGLGDAVPVQIDTTGQCFNAGQPNFDDICIIEFGPPGASAGLISLDFTGDSCSDSQQGVQGTVETIANGSLGSCFINEQQPPDCEGPPAHSWDDCVAVQGGQAQDVLTGFRARLSGAPPADHDGEGFCDGADANDIDDFDETVVDPNPPLGQNGEPLYEARDCDPNTPDVQASPRLMTIIVLLNPPTPPLSQGFPIHALAGFYLVGCTPEPLQDTNGDTLVDEDDLTIDDRKCEFTPPIGQGQVYGRFVSLRIAGGEAGPPNPSTTLFTISLVE